MPSPKPAIPRSRSEHPYAGQVGWYRVLRSHLLADTRLTNGLRVIIAPDRHAPVFSIAVNYDVGSRNERPGRTGFAHLFEHPLLVFNNGGNMNGTTSKDRTPWNLTLDHAAEKASDGDSGHSRVATIDWQWIPAERLHPKSSNSRCCKADHRKHRAGHRTTSRRPLDHC